MHARSEAGSRIARIDTPQSPEWVERLRIEEIPTLVLVKGKRPVARLDGPGQRAQIERMLAPHLAPREKQAV